MIPPKKLLIPSDSNEIEFTGIVKDKKENLYEYEYTKSTMKKGMKVTFTEAVLTKFLKNEIFKPIS